MLRLNILKLNNDETGTYTYTDKNKQFHYSFELVDNEVQNEKVLIEECNSSIDSVVKLSIFKNKITAFLEDIFVISEIVENYENPEKVLKNLVEYNWL